jgi:hypothetical protein
LPLRDTVGLCASCRHARTIVSAKKSTFWLCGSPLVELGMLPKYPPLPVHQCPGHAPRQDEEDEP